MNAWNVADVGIQDTYGCEVWRHGNRKIQINWLMLFQKETTSQLENAFT